jgi:WhiB family redox-sensing transcriptional regulator
LVGEPYKTRELVMGMEIFTAGNDADGLVWLDHAACADLDIGDFFVAAGHTISEETRATCRHCPVRENCVRHFYDLDISAGYGGGLSPSQRRSMTLDEALEIVRSETPQTIEADSAEITTPDEDPQ